MANKLSDAKQSLIRAQDAAHVRLEELDAERREIKSSIRSLTAALKALAKPSRQEPSRPAADSPPYLHDATSRES